MGKHKKHKHSREDKNESDDETSCRSRHHKSRHRDEKRDRHSKSRSLSPGLPKIRMPSLLSDRTENLSLSKSARSSANIRRLQQLDRTDQLVTADDANADDGFFIWRKKLEKEGKNDLSLADIREIQRRKMAFSQVELETVRRRRQERERDREQRDLEAELMQRSREAEYYRAWEKQEDAFHLRQAQLRSKIRIADGRAKPIDLLARYITKNEDSKEAASLSSVEMYDPCEFLRGLTVDDLEDLQEDIKIYMELEQGANAAYWSDITVVVEDELQRTREQQSAGGTAAVVSQERRTNINSAVQNDVLKLFRNKTSHQLELLGKGIREKLANPGPGVDTAYWESLLQQLAGHQARSRLHEGHKEKLRMKLEELKQQQGLDDNSDDEQDDANDGMSKLSRSLVSSQSTSVTNLRKGGLTSAADAVTLLKEEQEATRSKLAPELALEDVSLGIGSSKTSTAVPMPNSTLNLSDAPLQEKEAVVESFDVDDSEERELYESGRYSPCKMVVDELAADAVVVDFFDELKKLAFSRDEVRRRGTAGAEAREEEAELVRQARDGMTEDEAGFSVQVPLEQAAASLWSDKYRPRKPRFFNRVHTGYEWNKYNQTHYDVDNPPPKIVQGYKFNIFYPDLMDKSKTPQYTVTPCTDDKDFAVLRFSAGPPYEDIAFKVVRREWEYSFKHGFRCQFTNNIFQLWFHFKRYRYRR